MRNGGTCVLKDDMAEILGMFRKADVLVLATPVYFYGISAQMKTFIDRTYPIWQHLGKKEVYYIISAGLGEDIGRADRGIRQPDPIHGRAKRGSKAEESENRAL